MEFSQLLRQRRQALGMDTRMLALASGIDHGTISRIENGHVHPLVETAIRLCKALQIDPTDLMDNKITKGAILQTPPSQSTTYLNCSDLYGLSSLFIIRPLYVLDKIIELTGKFLLPNQKVLLHQEYSYFKRTPEAVGDRTNALLDYLQANYLPNELNNTLLIKIHNAGGAISFPDFGIFTRNIRKGKSLTLIDIEEMSGLSDSTISNLEHGNIQRIKVSDILLLEKVYDAQGDLFHLIWNAGELRERSVKVKTKYGWSPQERILFYYMICAYRYLQSQNNSSEKQWLSSLREFTTSSLQD
jgi:transcriptional regulator with XRE-family HTH domain